MCAIARADAGREETARVRFMVRGARWLSPVAETARLMVPPPQDCSLLPRWSLIFLHRSRPPREIPQENHTTNLLYARNASDWAARAFTQYQRHWHVHYQLDGPLASRRHTHRPFWFVAVPTDSTTLSQRIGKKLPQLPWPDIGHLGKWSVSSFKFGFGPECLKDDDPDTFWQCVAKRTSIVTWITYSGLYI